MAIQETNPSSQTGNSGESVKGQSEKGVGRELAVEQKAGKEENIAQSKAEKEKHPLVALLEVILNLMGITQEEKAHVKADPTIQKGASAQTIEASAARVAPERTSVKDMPDGELAKVAALKKDFSDNGIKMDQASPDHIAYNGGKAPQQQQATSHTV